MKYTPITTNQSGKEYKKSSKRGKNIDKLEEIMRTLAKGMPLPAKNRDHKLSGNYAGCRECHIEPDWLLVYRISGHTIIFERTGTHSDLFK